MKCMKVILAILISACILYFLSKNSHPEELILVIKQLILDVIILCFSIYSLSNVLKSYRLYLLVHDNRKFDFEVLNIVMFQTMLNTIVPFRLGELSLVHLLKRKLDKRFGEGVSFLVVI